MSVDTWPNAMCVICRARPAEPMTIVCDDDKCFQAFVDYQFKGRLKELLEFPMGQDGLTRRKTICVICKFSPVEPMTYVCKDEKCFQAFMDMQFKGRLKELLGI